MGLGSVDPDQIAFTEVGWPFVIIIVIIIAGAKFKILNTSDPHNDIVVIHDQDVPSPHPAWVHGLINIGIQIIISGGKNRQIFPKEIQPGIA